MRVKWMVIILLLVFGTGEVNPVRSKTPKASASRPKAGWTSNGVNTITKSGSSSLPSLKLNQFAVGQWVKYQVKRYAKGSDAAKPHELSRAELKISIVDKEIIEEQEFFWVEFLINEDKEQQRVVKFMIDPTGTPAPAKLILKYGNLEAVEIELRRWAVRTRLSRAILFEEMTRGLNIIPFTRSLWDEEKATEEKIMLNLEGQAMELRCSKVSFKETRAKTSGYIWYSDQVPLAGMAKFFLIEQRFRTLFLLVGYGSTGGKSVITEPPKQLNFRE